MYIYIYVYVGIAKYSIQISVYIERFLPQRLRCYLLSLFCQIYAEITCSSGINKIEKVTFWKLCLAEGIFSGHTEHLDIIYPP